MTDRPKSRRGFACMTPERRAEISRLGGASVAPENRAFSRYPKLASDAGRIGGQAKKPRK